MRKGNRTETAMEYGKLCEVAVARGENTVEAARALCQVPRVRPEGIRERGEADLAESALGRERGLRLPGGLR